MLKARPGQNPSAYDLTRSHSREHINTTAAEFNLSKLLEKSKSFRLYSWRDTLKLALLTNIVGAYTYLFWGDFSPRHFSADFNDYEYRGPPT
jgi:hypothetical protein